MLGPARKHEALRPTRAIGRGSVAALVPKGDEQWLKSRSKVLAPYLTVQ